MIPFDLERAKKGVPVRTRNGRKAVFVAHLDGGQPAPLIFDIWFLDELSDDDEEDEFRDVPSNDGNIENYYINGRFNDVHDSELDLFMEY